MSGTPPPPLAAVMVGASTAAAALPAAATRSALVGRVAGSCARALTAQASTANVKPKVTFIASLSVRRSVSSRARVDDDPGQGRDARLRVGADASLTG